MFIVYETQFEL